MQADGIHYLDAHAPDGMRIYAIGDVHGRLDLLEHMYALIDRELRETPPADWRIIHLGDYVDRGPNSKGVLDFLVARAKADQRIVTLAGNHDIGMLEFLEEPDPDGLFANYGGVETAWSYGVDLGMGYRRLMERGRNELLRAMPDSHLQFLASLKFSALYGDFFFCHAGIKPGVALDRQSPMDLIWIREEFHNHPGLYDKVVVHGHTPVHEVEVWPNRVNLDTGAFKTGLLSALVIEGGEKRIIGVSAEAELSVPR